VVRPQMLTVRPGPGANRLQGKVTSTSYLGGRIIYEVDIGEAAPLRVNTAISGQMAAEGDSIELGFAPSDCVIL